MGINSLEGGYNLPPDPPPLLPHLLIDLFSSFSFSVGLSHLVRSYVQIVLVGMRPQFLSYPEAKICFSWSKVHECAAAQINPLGQQSSLHLFI